MMMNNTTVHDVNTPFLLQESLRFRLQGSVGDIGSWGHEYVRNLAGEIGNEFQQRQVFITVRLGILLTFFLWECTANFAATRLCIPHSALS
jgi:hypothetical protein